MGKQLKINELKRVVNVDKFSKYADILKDKNFNDEKQIEAILMELSAKTPSRDVLMKTRLGFILKEISNRENLSKRVRDKAITLRSKWKEFHKRLLLAPKYDVKCDKPTTENRQKARQALTNCFLRTNIEKSVIFNSNLEDYQTIVNDLEFSIFQHCDKLVNRKYFNAIRSCIKKFSNDPKIRNDYLKYEIKTEELINKHLSFDNLLKFYIASSSSNSSIQSQPCTSVSTDNLFDLDELIDD